MDQALDPAYAGGGFNFEGVGILMLGGGGGGGRNCLWPKWQCRGEDKGPEICINADSIPIVSCILCCVGSSVRPADSHK